MTTVGMNLKIWLPFEIFTEKAEVLRVVVDTLAGSYGFLPHRLDCVAALQPGILIYETAADGVVYVAVDGGVLLKTGQDVLVSVRRAIGGKDLGSLRESVEKEFATLNASELRVRAVMHKLEASALHRLATLQHE